MEKALGKTVLNVAPHNVPFVMEVLEKATKKAEKLGVAKPVYEKKGPFYKDTTDNLGFKIQVPYFVVEIDPGQVKLPGYTFLGKMEHEGKFNLLYPVPGAHIDEKYRTTDCYCDHCKLIRDRKMLYVFKRDADGQQIQIGKNCLRDFMGIDPAVLAYYQSYDKDFASREDDDGYWGGGSRYYIDLRSFTTVTAAVIEAEGGYISNTAAKNAAERGEGVQSTSGKVSDYLFPPKFGGGNEEARRAYQAWRSRVQSFINDDLKARVEEAIRWIKEDWKNSTDYAWNLKVIAEKGSIDSDKQYGIGASLWPTYMREMGRLKEIELKRAAEKEASKSSDFVGKVGERLKKVEAHVQRSQFIKSGEWGDTYLYKFVDGNGMVYSWFTGPQGLHAGDKVIFTGTVKDHKEYQGAKETQLTRCKVEVTQRVEQRA
jgi:hypothetical protein